MTKKLTGTFAALLTLALACLLLIPFAAFAEERDVSVENHTTAQDQKTTVSNIRIGGVDAPEAGKQLDGKAEATTAEGKTWDIPVLWVRDDLTIMPDTAEAEANRTYLPVLAFFVPDDCAIEGSDYKVTLSDSLTKLFGTEQTISVYSKETGITYILPASLKDLFVYAANAASASAPSAEDPQAADDSQAGEDVEPTLVEIHCAQTARNALTDDDLEWLIDLVVNGFEPQAVNLLIDRFPAFRAAAENGEIGTQISLYIYYAKGDDDGDPAHTDTSEDTIAYVTADGVMVDGELRYCYMLAVDASSLIMKDENEKPLIDPVTGKYILARSGEDVETLANTIVHELFHAFMDDYNRLGMFGNAGLGDREMDENGNFINKRTDREFDATRYPYWFLEGTASSVENTIQFRRNYFYLLISDSGQETLTEDILNNYLNASSEGKPIYFDLEYSTGVDENGNDVNPSTSRYVSGYLAVLYLSELAYKNVNDGDSSMSLVDGKLVFSSEKLCLGLNQIVEWLHDDDTTLDAVISHISPTDEQGNKLYSNTDAFTKLFIKGAPNTPEEGSQQNYSGDQASLAFVSLYLSYLVQLEKETGFTPNGSVLFDFDNQLKMPLDPNKTDDADFYEIMRSNTFLESSVSSDRSTIGGGKSYSSNSPYTEIVIQVASVVEAADAANAAGVAGTANATDAADVVETASAADATSSADAAPTQETSEPAAAEGLQEAAAGSDAAAETLPLVA